MFTADRGPEIQDTGKIHVVGVISLNCRGLGCPGLSVRQCRATDLPRPEQLLKVSAGKHEGTPSKKHVYVNVHSWRHPATLLMVSWCVSAFLWLTAVSLLLIRGEDLLPFVLCMYSTCHHGELAHSYQSMVFGYTFYKTWCASTYNAGRLIGAWRPQDSSWEWNLKESVRQKLFHVKRSREECLVWNLVMRHLVAIKTSRFFLFLGYTLNHKLRKDSSPGLS